MLVRASKSPSYKDLPPVSSRTKGPHVKSLKQLIAEATARVVQSGWANTDWLTAGNGIDYDARYLRLAGVTAGLRIDYKVVKQMPDRPLWLWFFGEPTDSVSVDQVGTTLGSLAEPGLDRVPGTFVYLSFCLKELTSTLHLRPWLPSWSSSMYCRDH